MKRIFKYALALGEFTTVYMPRGSTVLSVHGQDEGVSLWALVAPWIVETEARRFYVGMTGHELPRHIDTSRRDCVFVGTVLLHGGSFVVHVFDVTELMRLSAEDERAMHQ